MNKVILSNARNVVKLSGEVLQKAKRSKILPKQIKELLVEINLNAVMMLNRLSEEFSDEG